MHMQLKSQKEVAPLTSWDLVGSDLGSCTLNTCCILYTHNLHVMYYVYIRAIPTNTNACLHLCFLCVSLFGFGDL